MKRRHSVLLRPENGRFFAARLNCDALSPLAGQWVHEDVEPARSSTCELLMAELEVVAGWRSTSRLFMSELRG